MSGKPSQNTEQMFNSLKAMFPHIDLSIINQELSFSQNLQNLISQLGRPALSQTYSQITNMKEAVDQQQLKIQKSLVNQQDVLGNITNRSLIREKKQKQEMGRYIMNSIEEQQGQSKCQSQFWHNEQNIFSNHLHHQKQVQYTGKSTQEMRDIIQQIWEMNSQNMKDWFHH